MSTTKKATAYDLEPLALTMLRIIGTVPLATAISTLMLKTGAPRGLCADGIRLGVNHRRIKPIRMTGGDYSVTLIGGAK